MILIGGVHLKTVPCPRKTIFSCVGITRICSNSIVALQNTLSCLGDGPGVPVVRAVFIDMVLTKRVDKERGFVAICSPILQECSLRYCPNVILLAHSCLITVILHRPAQIAILSIMSDSCIPGKTPRTPLLNFEMTSARCGMSRVKICQQLRLHIDNVSR